MSSKWFVTLREWDYNVPTERTTLHFTRAGIYWFGTSDMIRAGTEADAIEVLPAAPEGWRVSKAGVPYRTSEERP